MSKRECVLISALRYFYYSLLPTTIITAIIGIVANYQRHCCQQKQHSTILVASSPPDSLLPRPYLVYKWCYSPPVFSCYHKLLYSLCTFTTTINHNFYFTSVITSCTTSAQPSPLTTPSPLQPSSALYSGYHHPH